MQNLGKHTERTAKSFHALKVGAGIALVAAAGAAVKFGSSSVRAYVEAQTAQVKLQDAYRKFPKLADTNISSLRALNTQLALKTKFDDDATASGQAVLAQFKLTGQQITQLTPLLQDYAAKTGKDLPTAARDLGKAVLGQGRSLKAVGINFKDTGTAGGNLDQIMKGLRTQVGGFATEEGKSAAGQAAILKNQFGELQESAGKVLLPALLKVGRGLLKVVGLVQDNSAIFKTLGETVRIVFSSMAGSIGVGKGSFKDFSDWVATHQEDITTAIINGGKAFVKFGITVVKTTAAGLRGFGAFADGVGETTSFILGQYADMAHGAALAFGWIPGIGPKLMAADVKFRVFATNADNNSHRVGNAARDAAAGLEGKLLPGLNKAGTGLDAYGRKAITAARSRDIVAKAEKRHEVALAAASKAAKDNGKTLDSNTISGRSNRVALNGLVSSSQNYISKLIATHASSKKVTQATKDARAEFIQVATKMGLSSKAAKDLADKYFKIPKKVEIKHSTPGGAAARNTIQGVAGDIKKVNGKHVTVGITVNSTLDKLNKAAVRQFGKGAFKLSVATGGVLPGFTPGRDVHRFYSPTGGQLELSGGEAIMRPEWTRAVGGPAAVKRMNVAARRRQAFAGGGVVSRNLTAAVNVRGSTYNYSKLRDFVAGETSAAVRAGTTAAVRQGTRAAVAAGVAAAKKAAAQATSSASGSVAGYSAGMAGTIARMRAAGARSFTTYPGHHPSMGKARDVTPHNWKIANVARASRSVWYVIYRMRIASKNHGNSWRQYHPISNRGDFRHTRHIHVAWYDKGGMMQPGGVGVNAGRRPERVLSPAQTKSFDNLVRVLDRRGGGAGVTVNQYISLPHYVGSTSDLKRALVDLSRRGELAVIQR